MIEFNLLPDIKLTYMKAQRTKHMVIVTSVLVAGVALAILILLFLGVAKFQKDHMNNLTADIKTRGDKLKNTQDLSKILTVQNQINSLQTLHPEKPETSRLFKFMQDVTPNALNIQKIDIDFDKTTINLSGTADTISTINKFVDTLKFTKYGTSDNPSDISRNAFSKVVLGSFGLSPTEKDPKKKASYQIAFVFDKTIFNDTNDVTLVVPKIISTRSETEKPNALFDVPTPTQPVQSR